MMQHPKVMIIGGITRGLEPEEIGYPVRGIFRAESNINFLTYDRSVRLIIETPTHEANLEIES